MKVIRNTYPRYAECAHAEPGDEVEWTVSRRGTILLRRQIDGADVFSRDRLPKHEEDTRPMVGVIASAKSRGWILEIAP